MLLIVGERVWEIMVGWWDCCCLTVCWSRALVLYSCVFREWLVSLYWRWGDILETNPVWLLESVTIEMEADCWRLWRGNLANLFFAMKNKLIMTKLGLFALDFSSTMGIKSKRVFYWVRGKGRGGIGMKRHCFEDWSSRLGAWVALILVTFWRWECGD